MMTVNVQLDPLALRYSVVIRPDLYEDGTVAYIAEIPELPGCKAHGATIEEARASLADAQREYLEALQQEGQPIPAPDASPMSSSVVWTVSVQGQAVDKPPMMAPSVSFALAG